MNETVSVEQAVKRFWMVVIVPLVFGTIGFFISGFILGSFLNNMLFWVLGGFVCSILFAGLYWSRSLYRWFVWAYSNVDNAHELKKAIDTENIVFWGDWEEKLSKQDPDQYNNIQQKLNQPFEFKDDPTVPVETVVRYSVAIAIRIILLGLFIVISGIKFYSSKGSVGALFIGLAGLALVIWQLILLVKKEPKIVLNSEGVWTFNSGFTSWEDIMGEDIELDKEGKNRVYYLIYRAPNGNAKVKINYLGISTTKLLHLLLVYRCRNKEAR